MILYKILRMILLLGVGYIATIITAIYSLTEIIKPNGK
jgi:hypothetical protein